MPCYGTTYLIFSCVRCCFNCWWRMRICIKTYIFHNVIHYWRSIHFRIHLWLSSVLKVSSPTGIRFICLNSANFQQNLQNSGWWWQTRHHSFVTHTDTRLISYESQDCWKIALCSKRFPTLWAGEEMYSQEFKDLTCLLFLARLRKD
jgi:hypothetical protein